MSTTTTTETPRTGGGPRTPEGKARSAMNAIKHGFSGRTILVAEDEQEDYQAFLEEWESELDPAGPVESELFGQIITAAWTLRRLSRAEADLMDESLADPSFSTLPSRSSASTPSTSPAPNEHSIAALPNCESFKRSGSSAK